MQSNLAAKLFDDRMTPGEVSRALGVSVGTLAVWRCTGRYALPFVKIGSKVFYRREDVQRFIEAGARGLDATTRGGAA